ncbi:DUF6850 family outer membrane beta-barrel protein [Draconibacterium mangrovi]|uniref:DUF6850 family outer membrane beta-barrel protein n=1 Tax=Draconibacterium mangrovi TaxID=2697469 RepID=UPI0013D399B7|nr:DUF6850 family outer membrane beta-barrel protein [Draconibacterium mangrovi]
MSKVKYIALFIVVWTATTYFGQAIANETDSLQSSLSSESMLLLKSPWSSSENAAGLQFIDITQRLGKASLFYRKDKGNFHRFQEADENLQYGFYTNGYTTFQHWKFYGDFSYYKHLEKDILWTDVMHPYNDNPYTIGDDIGGKYRKEYFEMNAKAAWHISNALNFGSEMNYQTGVGTRRKDPRPVNKETNFKFKPGLVYTFNRFNLGLNLKIETATEDINIELVTDSAYTYYNFKGLGTFSSTFERDPRIHQSTTFGGSLQFGFTGKKLQNMTEIGFFQKETDIKRGESVPLQVVLLEKFQTDVNSVFLINPNKQSINRLKFTFNDKHIYGHEPVIEPKVVQENFQWETITKYVLYWHKENTVGLTYDYLKLVDNNHFNWGTSFGGNIYTSETKYFFVPEKNKQKLNYYMLNAAVKKEILASFANIVIEINGAYQNGFNSSFQLVEDEILQQSVNTDFVETDFNYFNNGMAEAGLSVSVGKNIKLYSKNMQLYLDTGYKKQFSQMPGNPNRSFVDLQFGVNF